MIGLPVTHSNASVVLLQRQVENRSHSSAQRVRRDISVILVWLVTIGCSQHMVPLNACRQVEQLYKIYTGYRLNASDSKLPITFLAGNLMSYYMYNMFKI